MINELTTVAYWAWPEVLSEAIGRAIAAVGAGTAVALILAALVLGVEALRERPRKPKRRRPAQPPLLGKRRGATSR